MDYGLFALITSILSLIGGLTYHIRSNCCENSVEIDNSHNLQN